MVLERKDIEYVVTECVRRLLNEDKESLHDVLEAIDRLPTDKICDYLRKRFHFLGSGISRSVYQFDDSVVIKVATGRVNQNEDEWKAFQDFGRSPLLARVYWHAWDYRWLVSEYVVPARPIDFVNILGVKFKPQDYNQGHPERFIDKFDALRKRGGWAGANAEYNYQNAVQQVNDRELYYQYYGRDAIDTKDEDAYETEMSVRDFIDWCDGGMPNEWECDDPEENIVEEYRNLIKSSPWFRELADMVRVGMSDLHIDNFGIAKRDGKECIVVIDYGIIGA